MGSDVRLLTAFQVAERLGVSRRTVDNIAWLRGRKVYVRPKAPRWKPEDVDLYIARQQGNRRAS
jgi:predicted DNA-binding transcriptional regulator AlpA